MAQGWLCGGWGDWGVHRSTGGSSQCGMEVEGERGGKLKVRAGGWRLQAGSVYLESIIQLGNDNKQPK